MRQLIVTAGLSLAVAFATAAEVEVRGDIVSYQPGKSAAMIGSDGLARVKAMEKRLPAELMDVAAVREAWNSARPGGEKTSKGRASRGGAGSGEQTLARQIPRLAVMSDPEIGSMEYGETVDGFNLPYTTSRVDMYGANFAKKRPYRAAGQLFFKDGGDSYICSASMIKRGIAVTAAHCVSSFGEQRFYTDFQYIPARKKDQAPYGVWTAENVYIKSSYYNGDSDECIDGVVCYNDVAVIVLSPQNGKYAGDYTGWFGYGIGTYSYLNNRKAQITQLGYPASHDSAEMMQRNDSMGIKVVKYNRNTLIGSRMTGGSSGGPWLVNFGQKAKLDGTTLGSEARSNVVVGVTSWGYISSDYKIQGASPFTGANIGSLVKAACGDYPDACQ